MIDNFANSQEGLQSPARNAAAVTTSDSTDLDYATRAVWVGGAGNVKVTMLGGQTTTFLSVPAGTCISIRVSRIWQTGTTATGIVAIW